MLTKELQLENNIVGDVEFFVNISNLSPISEFYNSMSTRKII